MTLIAIAAEAAESQDLWRAVLLSLFGGGGAAVGSLKLVQWAAARKRKPPKFGWKWGTWFAPVDIEAIERELAVARADAAKAKAEAAEEIAKAKAEAARETDRARAIASSAEAKWAKAEALIKQCQDHTEVALRERDRLALHIATQKEKEKRK